MLSVLSVFVILISFSKNGFAQESTTPSGVFVDNVCICVTAGFCNLAGGSGNTDGAGLIDPRIMASGPPASPITGANNESMTPASTGIKPVIVSRTSCATGLDLCCPPFFQCGLTFPPVEGSPQPLEGQAQAAYGAFPWQVAILKMDNTYISSGALIDHLHIVTVAHKVSSSNLPLKVRFGDWDAANEVEPFPHQEINAVSVFSHPRYNSANLQNNLAIIRLASPAPLGLYPTITNICLPSAAVKPMKCWVSGWGKNDFSSTGAYQAIMKSVDVPLVDSDTCVTRLRATRLGRSFSLHSSFVCAGGEAAKDACTGDGGSPLACKIGNKWFLQGLVAWGIGCGQANVPGVYVNIQAHVPWIQQTTALPNVQSSETTAIPASPTASPGVTSATTRPPTTIPPSTIPPSTIPPTTVASVMTTLRLNAAANATTRSPTVAVIASTVRAAATTARPTVRQTIKATVKAASATTIKPVPSSG